MPYCKEHERLESARKLEMQTYAQFTYKENQHLRGVGDRKAKELAKEAMARATQKVNEMADHRHNCPVCNGSDAAQ